MIEITSGQTTGATRSDGDPCTGKGTPLSSLRVLVADDASAVRRLQCAILEDAGCTVIEAANGADALHRLRENHIDVLLSDVDMPRMNGFALVEAVRSDPRLHALPVVLLSGLETDEELERAAQSGATAYLGKGNLGTNDLVAVLHACVSREAVE